jgi:E3 ubiquitin-protein ligase makorin
VASRDTTNQPKLVTLKRDPSKIPKTWVQAPEFVPGRVFHGEEEEATSTWDVGSHSQPLTYSGVAGAGLEMESEFLDIITTEDAASLMCPFAEMGVCPFGESCEYTHGDLCELCGKECLSPFDPEQRKAHHRECVESHEQEMERAFAAQKSEGKTCGICMEVVLCKVSLSDRRFGILSHCDHCFCLSCIRKWRSSTHARKITIRACPLCRTVSHFVIPSQVWVDEEEEKQKLIDHYKSNLRQQHCKHFNRGEGTCPFGNSCFYRHEYPDGTKAIVQPRVAVNDQGEGKLVGSHTLWQFIEERDNSYEDFVEWRGSSSESDDDL